MAQDANTVSRPDLRVVGWSIMILQPAPFIMIKDFKPHCPKGWEVLETLYGQAHYIIPVVIEPEDQLEQLFYWKASFGRAANIQQAEEPVFYFDPLNRPLISEQRSAEEITGWFENFRQIPVIHREMIIGFRSALAAGCAVKHDWTLWDKFIESDASKGISDRSW